MNTEKLRLDKYLWAIRLFKTRSLATEACTKGKVYFNGSSAKASKQIIENDEYEVKTAEKKWRIKVTGLLSNRVAFTEAIKYYIDLTPAEEIQKKEFVPASFYTGKRMSKTGKPTKKQKRDRDNFFNQ
ncbi:MAG: RNA-binding S4 domain-containing protein [Chitinophagaceae bacterium]|nr:RNA-binding S4 domain-containing protein [Chitinophagaceae bacterium]